MDEYITRNQLRDRLTLLGYEFVADRNLTGEVEEAEAVATIDPYIQAAGNFVDEHIQEKYDTTATRSAKPTFLVDHALAVGAFLAFSSGGRGIPKSVMQVFELSKASLERIRDKNGTIPNYPYLLSDGTSDTGGIKVFNIKRKS